MEYDPTIIGNRTNELLEKIIQHQKESKEYQLKRNKFVDVVFFSIMGICGIGLILCLLNMARAI
jgi:uncharacterized membrane protein YukC